MTNRKYDYEYYLNKSKKLTKFLEKYENKKSTHRSYKLHLVRYFQTKGIKDIDKYVKDTRMMDKKEKIEYLDKLESDLTDYWKDINKQYTGKTPYVWLSAIKMFLIYNKTFELDNVYMDLQKNGHGNYAITDTKTPTKEELLKIFSYSNPESKALFMFQLTSGQRISQVVGTTFDNIDMNFDCPRVRYPTAKQKFWVKTRITPEAKKILQEYLDQRQKFIDIRDKRGKLHRKTKIDTEKRIFSMTTGNAEQIWRTMVENAGLYELDPVSKKPVFGSHCLRRYFLSHFGDETWGDFFSGHITTRNKEYRKYSDEKLDIEYNKHVNDLNIFETSPELSGINEQMQEKDETIKEMQKKIDSMDQDIRSLTIKLLTLDDKKKIERKN